jgi:murein DD-endopeptidase MepM/ murein hydrolase activator NlpD
LSFSAAASVDPVVVPDPEPAAAAAPTAPEAEVTTAFRRPVEGEVLRAFSARNEGIDFRAAEGAPVSAAAGGTVAAITRDTDQVPILVLRHADGLLSVYANIKDIRVEKGDAVRAGQRIAAVGGGSPPFLHFEIRRGFDAVDPAPLLR